MSGHIPSYAASSGSCTGVFYRGFYLPPHFREERCRGGGGGRGSWFFCGLCGSCCHGTQSRKSSFARMRLVVNSGSERYGLLYFVFCIEWGWQAPTFNFCFKNQCKNKLLSCETTTMTHKCHQHDLVNLNMCSAWTVSTMVMRSPWLTSISFDESCPLLSSTRTDTTFSSSMSRT